MESPTPSRGSDDDDDVAAAICCMCGDRGMPHELFRCKLCRLRSQHRYCSELYPTVTAKYGRCNWCLRKDGVVGGSAAAAEAVEEQKKSTTSPETMDSSGEGKSSRRSGGGCSRSDFSAEPGKPVKKPKLAGDEKAAVLPAPEAGETTKGRKTQAAVGKSRFKVKVRRYKLLAEVMISC